jgi:large subunit ribosomal protein L24
VQTTLLGLAIAFIMALTAALIGPYFIDWNQFRPQFEAEASRVIGAPVRVSGPLDARLLPAPSLRLRSIVVGGPHDPGKVRADKLDVEFSLSSLMRGEWRATELTVNGAVLDLGLDAQGRVDLPTSTGRFSLGSLAIDRLNLTGRISLHDAASRTSVELSDIAFSGDVRSLAGAIRGDGNFTMSGSRYPFRVASSPAIDGSGTRVHFNIDPGARAVLVDLDGVLSFDARAPRFDGAISLAGPKAAAADDSQLTPWRLSARVKANPATARLEQLEASYGPEETALKLAGLADIRFGTSPLLHAVLSAKQLDADRLIAQDSTAKDGKAKQPTRLLSGLRQLVAAIPQAPVATQIEISAEQIMLGGRAVQNVGADVHGDRTAWTVDRLELRAPGSTRVALSGQLAQPGPSGRFKGAVSVDSSDPDTLAAWLQGRSEVSYRSQKPLRLRGDLTAAVDRLAIDAMKAEIDGGAVEGRVMFSNPAAGGGSRFEGELKADTLNLDSATALIRSLGGPQDEWPDAGQVSLDIGRATSAGQEMRPFVAQLGYNPKTISIDRLRIGDAGGVMLDGSGAFNRIDATGKLAVSGSSQSLKQMTGLIAPLAPAVAARLNAMAPMPGAVSVKLALDLGRDRDHPERASARAVVDITAPQISGVTTITATPLIAALRGFDLDALSRSNVSADSNLSATQGGSLLALLGLDGVAAAGNAPLRFEGAVTGSWRSPLQLKAKLSGAELNADAQGTAEWSGEQPKAAVMLAVGKANLAPLFDLKPSDAVAQNISLASRVALAGNKLTFEDIDGTVAGTRLRGRIAMTFGTEKSIDGQLGLDTIDIAPAFGLAIGSRGHDVGDPLGRGLLQGWRGQLGFQALRGTLPGGGELRPFGGVVKSDGQSLTIDAIKGGIGGGDASADLDIKPSVSGFALNGHVQLSNVDGAALHYGALTMPAGRTALRMTVASQGRSASALEGALSGNGLLTISGARIAGLDPRAFDVAIRATDDGRATDDNTLRQIVEPALSVGMLSVSEAQIPFVIKDGRLRVSATTLEGEGARVIVSGGYDIAADQTDIRSSLTATATGASAIRPEIQVFAVGAPDRLNRTVDIASLSSWLAVRAIDRETRRLDLLERGEAPAAAPPIAAPPAGVAPADATPDTSASPPPGAMLPADVPLPGRDLRRVPLKPVIPRVVVAPSALNAPAASQQLAPLPAPIDVRPAPGSARTVRPRPSTPLVLTPPPNAVRSIP